MLGLALLWTFAGCTTVKEKFDKLVDHLPEKITFWSKPAPPEPDYYLHNVRYPGETLTIIAEWYSGDKENWRALAAANPILNPDHIDIGAKIRVPKKLLHNRERMPKEFVEAVEKRREAEKARLAKAAAPARAKPARPKPAYYYHRVRYSGETLSMIAKWYTGDAENWHALTRVNPELDPNRIIIGAQIRIPGKLLNTREPMPQDFIDLPRPVKEPTPSPSALSQVETSQEGAEPAAPSPPLVAETGELELFGPR